MRPPPTAGAPPGWPSWCHPRARRLCDVLSEGPSTAGHGPADGGPDTPPSPPPTPARRSALSRVVSVAPSASPSRGSPQGPKAQSVWGTHVHLSQLITGQIPPPPDGSPPSQHPVAGGDDPARETSAGRDQVFVRPLALSWKEASVLRPRVWSRKFPSLSSGQREKRVKERRLCNPSERVTLASCKPMRAAGVMSDSSRSRVPVGEGRRGRQGESVT